MMHVLAELLVRLGASALAAKVVEEVLSHLSLDDGHSYLLSRRKMIDVIGGAFSAGYGYGHSNGAEHISRLAVRVRVSDRREGVAS